MDLKEQQKQDAEVGEWVAMWKEKGTSFLRETNVDDVDMTPYRNKVIADMGCGPRPFVEHYPARVGIMLDCCMREYQREGLLSPDTSEKVACIDCMAERIPLRSKSVDHLFCINMLDHCFDPESVVQEFCRVIKNGGWMHVNVDVGGEPTSCEPSVFDKARINDLFSSLQLVHEGSAAPSNPGRDAMEIRVYRQAGDTIENAKPMPNEDHGNAKTSVIERCLDVLACPTCHGALRMQEMLECASCESTFPIEERIAMLKPREARE